MKPTKTLKNVEAALRTGEFVTALDALLAAWNERRLGAVATYIERLSKQFDRALPSIDGKTRKAYQEAWLDTEGLGRAGDVERLLAALLEPPTTKIKPRIARLALRQPDPRVSRVLTEFAVARQYSSTGARRMWTQVFTVLRKTADPAASRYARARRCLAPDAAVAAPEALRRSL